MCAIFGFIAKKGQQMPVQAIQRIAQAQQPRGPHAFGFAWVDDQGHLRMFKQRGKIVDHLGVLALARKARMFIGHTRWVTQGDAGQNINNHPHPIDGGWLVHNGVVTNYAELVSDHGLWTNSACDTEAIGLLAELAPRRDVFERVRWAINQTDGNLATLSLWARPYRMVVARRGNPLHTSVNGAGRFFATIGSPLPGAVQSLPDDHVTEYTYNGRADIVSRTLDLDDRAMTWWDGPVGSYTKADWRRASGRRTSRFMGVARGLTFGGGDDESGEVGDDYRGG